MNSSRVLTADAVAAFAVFARHRNFTSAAGELHLTQPSLHTKIAKLSRQLDTTLYERVGRELRLTPDGEALAAFANDQQRAADDYLARRADPSRTIHLAAGRASIQWVLDQPLRALVSTGTRLRVTPTNGARAIELVELCHPTVGHIARPSNAPWTLPEWPGRWQAKRTVGTSSFTWHTWASV